MTRHCHVEKSSKNSGPLIRDCTRDQNRPTLTGWCGPLYGAICASGHAACILPRGGTLVAAEPPPTRHGTALLRAAVGSSAGRLICCKLTASGVTLVAPSDPRNVPMVLPAFCPVASRIFETLVRSASLQKPYRFIHFLRHGISVGPRAQ